MPEAPLSEILVDNTAVSGTTDAAILDRCKRLDGKTFLQAKLKFRQNNGVERNYRKSDLIYDLDKKHLILKDYSQSLQLPKLDSLTQRIELGSLLDIPVTLHRFAKQIPGRLESAHWGEDV